MAELLDHISEHSFGTKSVLNLAPKPFICLWNESVPVSEKEQGEVGHPVLTFMILGKLKLDACLSYAVFASVSYRQEQNIIYSGNSNNKDLFPCGSGEV